ncbi:IDEAL domain-containing protein [Halalkalibacterium ligniniphilum]|uniref:IDEAL domain-containing protein n=1 Tax=Halalkalibacterium ligniniphilum TaxID=1134413 RepID=UPI000345A6E6|nr:IDEAL domain-containing protein [Halalkalibacterium ligniniphilum]
MENSHNKRFVIGDWVKGKLKNGELLHGFIQTIDPIKDIIRVHVVACENEDTIGSTIGLPSNAVQLIPNTQVNNEEQIYTLIDLALLTKDEQWFNELTTALKTVEKTNANNKPIASDSNFGSSVW